MPDIETARSWYPNNDAVHGFDHILRVLHTAEKLARLEGADPGIVRAAVLLHDAQPPQSSTNPLEDAIRQNHHQTSAEFAREVLLAEGWEEGRIAAVQHCIRAHRFRDDSEQPQTIEAKILFDADKLDAIGAIGVARAMAYVVQAHEPFYTRPSASFLHEGQSVPGEAHSAYHEYCFKLRKLKERLYTRSARLIAEQRHQFMAEYFEHLKNEMEGQE